MLAVKRPLLVGVLNLLIVIAGLAAFAGIEVRELPNVDRPIVSVSATFPGAAPETMDREVTSILEDAIARVTGVRQIRSSSEENNSRIRAEFNPGVDLDTAASDVREAVSRVTRDLPDRVEQVNIVKADADAQPIMTLAVSSERYGEAELTQLVENDVVPELLTADGVASIDEFGTRALQMRVSVDPARLNRFGLTMSDVSTALEGAPYDVPVGSFRSNAQELVVRADASATDPGLVRDVIVAGNTRIGDVADVTLAPADATNFVRLDGRPIVGLGVVRQASSNTIQISDSIRASVDRINARYEDITISIVSDDADFIKISVREVLITLSFTVLVVVGTMLLFFRAWRPTVIPSTTIPVALIGVLAGIWALGFSVNLVTLLALVLATGLIVDDAIVVLENTQRLQDKGLGRRAAAVVGTRQVFFAVVATTAVLVSVFLPISFLPSEAGRLFREFGFVLSFAVIISSFVALSLVPALAAKFDLRTSGDRSDRLSRWGSRMRDRYIAALTWCLDRGKAVVGGAVLVTGLTALLFTQLDSELVPDEDRGVIEVDATGPDGVGLDFMDRELDEIEMVLQPYLDSGEIESTFSIVGRYDPNRVRVTAQLADWGERDRGQSDIVEELNGPLREIPGSRTNARGRGTLSFGGGGGGNIEVALTGAEYDQIYASALKLSEAIDTQSTILSNPDISYQPTQPQLSIRIDRQRASDLGVDLDDVAQTLRAMVGGDEIVDLNVGDQAVPIFLTSQATTITNPSDLRNLYVRTEGDALVPMSSITQIVEQGVAAELNRTAQRRAIEGRQPRQHRHRLHGQRQDQHRQRPGKIAALGQRKQGAAKPDGRDPEQCPRSNAVQDRPQARLRPAGPGCQHDAQGRHPDRAHPCRSQRLGQNQSADQCQRHRFGLHQRGGDAKALAAHGQQHEGRRSNLRRGTKSGKGQRAGADDRQFHERPQRQQHHRREGQAKNETHCRRAGRSDAGGQSGLRRIPSGLRDRGDQRGRDPDHALRTASIMAATLSGSASGVIP